MMSERAKRVTKKIIDGLRMCGIDIDRKPKDEDDLLRLEALLYSEHVGAHVESIIRDEIERIEKGQ